MTSEMDFYIKITCTFIAAGVIMKFMSFLHQKKMERAERQFQLTMQALELRHRRSSENLQSQTDKGREQP